MNIVSRKPDEPGSWARGFDYRQHCYDYPLIALMLAIAGHGSTLHLIHLFVRQALKLFGLRWHHEKSYRCRLQGSPAVVAQRDSGLNLDMA